jgi:SagB-type dehydrogenase family enzyme
MAGKALILMLAITLAGGVCRADDYADAITQAEDKAAGGQYEEALTLYARAFRMAGVYSADYYNAACIAALAGDTDAAFAYLNEAVLSDLFDAETIEDDPDLESLHADPRWRQVLEAIEAGRLAAEATLPEAREEKVFIDLPDVKTAGTVSVEEALNTRRSVRRYAESPLSLAEISQILWAAYGINYPVEGGPDFLRGGLRTAPSAGARYPLEIYLVARNVDGLAPGVYWYKSESHELVQVSAEDRWAAVADAAFRQPHFDTAAAALVYSAVFERNTVIYGKRGRERYVCMDLGHSAENVYLEARALKIGTCAIGAFGDLALKKAVNMTRAEEPLYIMPLGRLE